MTPDEIAAREFLISLRGYDRDEVAGFLRQIAEEHAHLQRRIRELESELQAEETAAPVVRQEPVAARSGDPRDAFRALGEETTRILVAAEESAQSIKQRAEERARQELETARRESRDEVEGARRTASKIVADAERRRNAVAEDIRNLESLRDTFLRDLRGAVKTAQGAMRGLQPGDGGDTNGASSRGDTATATRTRPAVAREAHDSGREDGGGGDDDEGEAAPPAPPASTLYDDGVDSVRVVTPPGDDALIDEDLFGDVGDDVADIDDLDDLDDLGAEFGDVDLGGTDEAGETTPQQLREQSLAGVRPGMLRRLKRSLQDVQNSVLDGVRRATADDELDDLLPTRDELNPLSDVGEGSLFDSYRAGLADGAALAEVEVSDDAEDPSRVPASAATFGAVLAHEVVASLKATLRAGLDAGETSSTLSERVGEVFRDLKGPVVEGIADEHLTRTYGYGVLDAWRHAGVASKAWVPGTAPRCPEDMRIQNAEAGELDLNDHFPTGEVVPPAHAGCDCALAPR